MKKPIKIIIFVILGIIFLYIPFYFTFNLVNPNLTVKTLGFKPYIILTNSMEPILNVGDIIVASKKDISKVNVGDIIAFKTKENYVVAHYVAKTYYGDDARILLRTKPNNLEADVDVDSESLDKWVISDSEYIGTVNLKIPVVGHALLFFQTKIGMLTIFSIVVVLILARYIVSNLYVEEELNAADRMYGIKPDKPLGRVSKAREENIEKEE